MSIITINPFLINKGGKVYVCARTIVTCEIFSKIGSLKVGYIASLGYDGQNVSRLYWILAA